MKNPVMLRARISSLLWLHLGYWLDRKGLSTHAQFCFRNGVVVHGKSSAEAGIRLGQLLLAEERNEEAAIACEQALQTHPENARLWCVLGAARRRLAQMDMAREAFERAILLDPNYAQAWNNLGEWWLVKGKLATALEKIEEALKLEPHLLEALNNRVATLYELGNFREAEQAAREAIDLHPTEAALHVNLGNVLLHTGKARLAVKAFHKALECDSTCPEAQMRLATLLGEQQRFAETLVFVEHEIAVKGESAQRLATLALAQQAKGDLKSAEITCRKLLLMQPNNVSALITLAGCLSSRGDHRGAIQLYEKALAENPDMPGIFSNIAFAATYLPECSAEEVFAYHHEWSVRFEKILEANQFQHEPNMEPDRPLRIGYVSGDFGRHPVGFLLRDVLRRHDHRQFQIYCYSMMRDSDDVTAAIRESADVWVDALLIHDDELAERINQDKIDILIDLSGHTAYNRLGTFARKPAPIQATWIGYFHSTGLESIDYFITDPFTTPAETSQLFSEIPVWLPNSRFCYSPVDYAPDVVPSPVIQKGWITFGSFNRIEKLVEPVITAWAKVLQGVPHSRLLLKTGVLNNQDACDDLRHRFAVHGIESGQLELQGPSSHQEMLGLYGDIDIALDPFPFNGGMTTLDALWMGVPIVTLAGKNVVSRQTTSALVNLGLEELIFNDLNTYIDGAIALANDIDRLAFLRQGMRKRMSESAICQPRQFARDLEALYRRMWHEWCQGGKLGTEIVRAPAIAENAVLRITARSSDRKKIRLVCGTRATEECFFKTTALGRSFSLYKEHLPFLELQLFPENSLGLPSIYNMAIDEADYDPATLVFVHDDVFLLDYFWTDHIDIAMQNFDIVGVAGNKRRAPGQTAWLFIDENRTLDDSANWSGVVGHGKGFQCEELSHYGPSRQECKLLDGLMLIADSTTLLKAQLRFDPRFKFHFYDMDFCRQAELKNLRMGTWPISVLHESAGEFSSESWRESLDIYLEKYGE